MLFITLITAVLASISLESLEAAARLAIKQTEIYGYSSLPLLQQLSSNKFSANLLLEFLSSSSNANGVNYLLYAGLRDYLINSKEATKQQLSTIDKEIAALKMAWFPSKKAKYATLLEKSKALDIKLLFLDMQFSKLTPENAEKIKIVLEENPKFGLHQSESPKNRQPTSPPPPFVEPTPLATPETSNPVVFSTSDPSFISNAITKLNNQAQLLKASLSSTEYSTLLLPINSLLTTINENKDADMVSKSGQKRTLAMNQLSRQLKRYEHIPLLDQYQQLYPFYCIATVVKELKEKLIAEAKGTKELFEIDQLINKELKSKLKTIIDIHRQQPTNTFASSKAMVGMARFAIEKLNDNNPKAYEEAYKTMDLVLLVHNSLNFQLEE